VAIMSARRESRRSRFVELSVALLGDTDLPESLASAYMKRIDAAHPGELDALIEAFEAGAAAGDDPEHAIESRVVADAALWATAREVITIWMTSRLPRLDAVAPEVVAPEQYFQGRLWSTIRAHPQGLSGGYFGYWHYEPER
jgi:hypothetical protein